MQFDRSGLSNAFSPFRCWFAAFPRLAEQIHHRGRFQLAGGPERQSAHRADLLFELARFERVDGQMTRVVRARREFVDDGLAFLRDEQLHAHQTHHIQRVHDFLRQQNGAALEWPATSRAGATVTSKNVIFVHVLEQTEMRERSVDAARGDHGCFGF